MTDYVVKVTEPALMQLCLMGLESYCIPAESQETYGLLWGSKARSIDDTIHYRIDHVLTQAEAERGPDEVEYNEGGIRLQIQLMENHWPELSFIGDIHTHPFADRADAERGWKLSDDDRKDVEKTNTDFWIEVGLKVNLVLSIHLLGNGGWANPGRIGKKENTAEWTVRNRREEEYYRLRLAAYVVNPIEDNDGEERLFLRPRHHQPFWDNGWRTMLPRGRFPQHRVRLEVPSVLGLEDI